METVNDEVEGRIKHEEESDYAVSNPSTMADEISAVPSATLKNVRNCGNFKHSENNPWYVENNKNDNYGHHNPCHGNFSVAVC